MKLKNNTDRVLYSFITEDAKLPESYYEELTEAVKEQTVREIALEILKSISNKVETLDTTPIDKSRGDISSVKDINYLQDAINNLKNILMEQMKNSISPEALSYLKIITESIKNINAYSAEFRAAYIEKKTLLILKYQSLICALFSSVSYLISALLDFKAEGISLKNGASLEFIAPLKSLKDFNDMVANGQFRTITKDLNTLHEEFSDLSKEQRESLTEASDVISLIVTGLKNMYTSADSDGSLTAILYKAAGVIMLIFSLREIYYSLFRLKNKYSDMVSGIKSFVNSLGGKESPLGNLASFAKSFGSDVMQATTMAKRDIDSENRNIMQFAKNPSVAPSSSETPSSAEDILDF